MKKFSKHLAILLLCALFVVINGTCETSTTQSSGFLKEFILNGFNGSPKTIIGIQVGPVSGDYYLLCKDGSTTRGTVRYNITDGTYGFPIFITLKTPSDLFRIDSTETNLYSTSQDAETGVIKTSQSGAFLSYKKSNQATAFADSYFSGDFSPSLNTYFATANYSNSVAIASFVMSTTDIKYYLVPDIPTVNQHVALAANSDDTVFVAYKDTSANAKIVFKLINFTTPSIAWSNSMGCPDNSCSMLSSSATSDGTVINSVMGVEQYVMLTQFSSSNGGLHAVRKLFSGSSSSTYITVWDMAMNGDSFYVLIEKVGLNAGFFLLNYDSGSGALKFFSMNPVNTCVPRRIIYNSITSEIAIGTGGCDVLQFHVVSPDYPLISPAFEVSPINFSASDVDNGTFPLSVTGPSSISLLSNTTISQTYSSPGTFATDFTENAFQDTVNIYDSTLSRTYAQGLTGQVINPPLTCSINDNVTISYSLESNGAEALPDWIFYDSDGDTLNFDTPLVETTTVYTFYFRTTFWDNAMSYFDSLVSITVNGPGGGSGGEGGEGGEGEGEGSVGGTATIDSSDEMD